MKRVIFVFLLLLILSFAFAETYTIGTGTQTQSYVPMYGLYDYGWSKSIYTAAEMAAVGLSNPAVITGIGYNVSNTPSYTFSNQQVYVRTTTLSSYTDYSYPGSANFVHVFTGMLSFSTGGWFGIEFDTPFQWDGASNLEILWENRNGSWGGGYPEFYSSQPPSTQAVYVYQDGSFPTQSGYSHIYRPNIRIEANQDFPDHPVLHVHPTSLHFPDVTYGALTAPQYVMLYNFGEGTLNLGANDLSLTGTNADDFNYDDSDFPVALDTGQSVAVPITLQSETEGDLSATFVVSYDGEDYEVELTANVLQPGTVFIGNGTGLQRFPWGHLYGYERSAAIYTMDEIGGVGILDQVGWFCGTTGYVSTPYKIYAGNYDNDVFAQMTFDQLTNEMTLVKEGNYTFNTTGLHVFNLDVPFPYTGGNLVVAVETNYGGSGTGSYPNIHFTDGALGSHMYWLQDSSPPAGAGTLTTSRPNLMLHMGGMDGDPQLTVSPQALGFGTVFNGALVGPRNVHLANIGGGSLTVNISDVSITGPQAAQFSIDDAVFPIVLNSAEAAQIPVYVQSTVEGTNQATLTVSHGGQTFNVQLTADVLPPGIVIIGEGTATQRQPFGHVWGYERSIAIYTADDIGAEGMLHQLGWYCQSLGSASIPYKIYVGSTTATVPETSSFATAIQDLVLVKEGTHHFNEAGWYLFNLDVPVPYTGGNLMVAVETNYGGSGGGTSPYFRYTSTPTNSHAYWYQDSSAPMGSGYANTLRPNIMLALAEMGGDPQLTRFPESLNFGEVANGALSLPKVVTVANIGGGTITLLESDVSFSGTHAAQFSYDESVFPITLESAQTFQIPLYATGTIPGNISGSFNISWQGETFSTTLTASILPPGLVIIGDGTADFKLPVNPFYGYSYTQQLYLQSEINMQDKQIEQIAFYWNGAGVGNLTKDWVIWMGHTSQNTLSNYIPITQLQQVFDGEVLAAATPGWVTIDLDVPFIYNNTDNLVIAIDENTPSYDGSSQFYYCTTSTSARSLRYYSDGTNPDPAAPPTPDQIMGYPNIRMLLYDIPTTPMLTFNPDSINFGGVAYNSLAGPRNVNVGNRGIGILTLTADNISFIGPQAEMFSIDDSVFPLNLATGVFAQIPVFVQGTQEGPITAHLVINYNDEDNFVQLFANVMTQGLVNVELGEGTQTNGTTDYPAPYGTWYRAFREQYLILANELNNGGGGPGNIESLSFHVSSLNAINPMTNYRIRLKHTTQTQLSTTFETGQYQQVFHATTLMPEVGWNTHLFDSAFAWDGASNILIDISTDMCAGSYSQNASTYFSATPFTSTIRWQSDSGSGMNQPTASYQFTNRPNMRLAMEQLDMLDMSAVSIIGPTTPSVNSSAAYTVRVRNLTPEPITEFTVKLMQEGNILLDSFTGGTLQPMQYFEAILHWTPTQTGPTEIYGRVELDGDENPNNDNTPPLAVNVMEEGLFVIQLGTGELLNTDTGGPTPYGTWYRAFREQYLIKADEIFDHGGAPGLISSLAWEVANLSTCSPMTNYRIRLKHTQQTTLSSSFEVGEYIQVWQHNSYMPEIGWNVHVFDVPFIWNGQDNLLIDIVCDQIPGTYTYNAHVYYTQTPFNSSLRYVTDAGNGTDGTTGTISTGRPNTRIFMLVDDMGSLTGTITEDGFPVKNVSVVIENSVFNTLTNNNGVYYFPFAPVGTQTVTASKHGYESVSHTVIIEEDEETVQDFIIVGTPEFAFSEDTWDFGDVTIGGSSQKDFQIINAGGGELTIVSITQSGSGAFALQNLPTLPLTLRTEQTTGFRISFAPAVLGNLQGIITVTDDQGRSHIISAASATRGERDHRQVHREAHELILTGNGVHSITIGDGNQEARIPLDFYWRNSMFETIFTNQELGDFVGMITGIKLYNNFYTNITSTPVKIWLGSTTQTNLANGWISSNQLTLVFNGMVNFPAGENTIAINFPEMYMHLDGGNLVMLVQRPMDAGYYSSMDYFKCQTIGSNRSRNVYSDSENFDPTNITGGTVSGQFPKITFEVIPGGVGHIDGIVLTEEGLPLPGVLVEIDVRESAAYTDIYGEFHIPNLLPNDYQLTFSKYGYVTQTANVTIEEDVTEEMEITLIEMPKVSILGRILASDTGQGIAGAELSFTGYADYVTATSTDGSFVIDSTVYAYNTYDYIISAPGYTTLSGSIEVGPQDYDMGDLTMNEIAFAPTQVAAAINQTYTAVNLSWNPPDPDAFEIVESFEGSTFPPTDWTQTITNNGPANIHGVRPTWCKFSVAENVLPYDGGQQAGLAWVPEHQDEWLFTPSFTCPPDAYLRFYTHLQMGSDGGDHYYIKVSNNGGSSWTALWDGAAQTPGLNNYNTPVIVDLTNYAGQMIKLAWHADDGADAFGMWYNWYIDDIYIGNFVRGTQSSLSLLGSATEKATAKAERGEANLNSIKPTIDPLEKAPKTASGRSLVGYRVWRLRAGQEENENSWVEITDGVQTETNTIDTGWQTLAAGNYTWAVKAIYTAEVASMPVFSNVINKTNINGSISGFVRRADNNQAIAGATISAGEGYTATTTASGFYNLSLPAGSYTVIASHSEYHSLTEEDVVVVPEEATTLNFNMIPTSNEDVVEITVTKLNNNYPNPFNPETTISYDIKEPANVRLDIYNMKGQLVRTLVNEAQSSGRYRVVFDAKDGKGNALGSGIYLYRLKAGSYQATRKMMLLE